ncbi:MAG: ribosome-binding ATPase YchF [Gemmatales bacterium]|nr:MAG: ribosome-binding ATPase YchF [Gemmatales bacterium]
MARIPDPRLDWLSAHFKPKKTTPATIEFLDAPGLSLSERRDNSRRVAILRDSGGLLIVLNGFQDPKPAEELRRFREELLFADLEIVTNRIEKLSSQTKKPKQPREREADQAELQLLKRVAEALEQNQPASTLGLKPEEEKALRSFQLLTLKPQFVLLNCADVRASQSPPPDLLAEAPDARQAPAKLELELAELSEEDRAAFMAEYGVTASFRDDILRDIYRQMGQIVFFTVGTDEVRAWSLQAGDDAVTGAGKIHTDLQKNFVRAEVVHFDDFQRVGSMKEAKNHGVYRLEGKTYLVQDGDIMHIL